MTDTIEPPLLETRGLGMRFGGLMAVNSVDLVVERGKITSVIGPNGAGKTTLFNCISGVLPPTTGAILLAGRDPRRSFSWRVALAAMGVGLITSIISLCIAWNINGLWRAAIRRPVSLSDQPFTYRAVWKGAASYLRGELAIERQSAGRWAVVTADGRDVLAAAETGEKADQLRQAYESISRAVNVAVERAGNEWVLTAGQGRVAFASRTAALTIHRRLMEITHERVVKRRSAWAAASGGFVLGALTVLSVWKRSRWTPEVVAAAGFARTFQNLRLFRRMTLLENVLVGLEAAPQRVSAARRLEEARRLLEIVGLSSRPDQQAAELAYGDRRRLEIARALALRPRLLLLDEPAAGMNATETAKLMQLIQQICASGVTVVLIEHEMSLVMGVSDRVVVLDYGRKIAEGPPQTIRHDPAVIEAYLGVRPPAAP